MPEGREMEQGGLAGIGEIASLYGGLSPGEGAEELYRLAGKIVCVEQEVANKVEMCVALKRNEEGRNAGAEMPTGEPGTEGEEAPSPLPGQDGGAPADIPGKSAEIGKKAQYLKYYWGEMETGRRLGVSGEQFASYIADAGSVRNTVAHSTAVHSDGTLTNVQEGRDLDAADLERFLRRTYRALHFIDRLCGHMGLDDYAGYVRQRREEGAGRGGGGRGAGKGGGGRRQRPRAASPERGAPPRAARRGIAPFSFIAGRRPAPRGH